MQKLIDSNPITILEYDNFEVLTNNEGTFYLEKEEGTVEPVVLIGAVNLTLPENENLELTDLLEKYPEADITGEHVTEPRYLYFRRVGKENE